MRAKVAIAVGLVAGVVAVSVGWTAPSSAQLPGPKLITPRLTPTPSPPPTPKPTPRPTPKPPPPKPSDDTSKPDNSGHGRRVVYSNPRQRVWLIDSQGRVVGTWKVSGKKDVPSGGTYSVFSRSRYATSEHGDYHMEYMVRFAHGEHLAIGFHSIPVDDNGNPAQSESELGTYKSHGCVRQKKSDALKMWDFAQVDTKVVVIY
jgi:lipoprotein-anchoring transpeptidase ErfK/SrfK